MRQDFILGSDFGHVHDPFGSLLPTGHGDVGALQVAKGQGVGHVSAQRGGNLVQRELGSVLELGIAKAESGVQHARQHRQ